jgi:hypothetical protein
MSQGPCGLGGGAGWAADAGVTVAKVTPIGTRAIAIAAARVIRPVRRMGGINMLVLLTLTWMSLSRPEDVCQVGGRKPSGRTKQATGHGQEALRVLEKRLHAICMTPPAPGRETMTLSLRRPDDQVAVSSETLHPISTPDRLETRLSARGA